MRSRFIFYGLFIAILTLATWMRVRNIETSATKNIRMIIHLFFTVPMIARHSGNWQANSNIGDFPRNPFF